MTSFTFRMNFSASFFTEREVSDWTTDILVTPMTSIKAVILHGLGMVGTVTTPGELSRGRPGNGAASSAWGSFGYIDFHPVKAGT
ncbi:hypothetical protein [Paenibacillus riograndensis]|uniref:hypothetical protein n=1 Tax=Paenibacillus riograndensis TaxID=483937 RepID=UPI000B12F064|nr:hypothetical protein [Paenibacillus riograndensis]